MQKGVAYPTNDMTWDEYDALARQMTDTTFGSQIYGGHYHTWRSTVGLMGVLDGKHTILDGEYDFMKPYYEMVLSEEADGVVRKYTDLEDRGTSLFRSVLRRRCRNDEYGFLVHCNSDLQPKERRI